MIIISLGSNLNGPWGTPHDTLERAFAELNKNGLSVIKRTPLLKTAAIGHNSGGDYTNALAEIRGFCPPSALLRRLKYIEDAAGRHEARFAQVCGRLPRWRPRALDLDIIDWHGIVIGPQSTTPQKGYVPLTLPHPALYTRGFIQDLLPLLEGR